MRRSSKLSLHKARLRATGTETLSDAEVIAALLGTAEVAGELVATYGDLASLSRADLADLEDHVGPAKAFTLAALRRLSEMTRSCSPEMVHPAN